MKKVSLSLFLLVGTLTMAQVGINTDAPKSTLDIHHNVNDVPNGVLVPRLTAADVTGMTVTAEQNSLLAYITEEVAVAQRNGIFRNIDGPSFYYYKHDAVTPGNSAWTKFVDTDTNDQPSGFERLPEWNSDPATGINWQLIGAPQDHTAPTAGKFSVNAMWIPADLNLDAGGYTYQQIIDFYGAEGPYGAIGNHSFTSGILNSAQALGSTLMGAANATSPYAAGGFAAGIGNRLGVADQLTMANIALGNSNRSLGNSSVAIGVNNESNANHAVAIGIGSQATADNTVALGQEAFATGLASFAVQGGQSSGNRSIAIGYSEASGANSISIGPINTSSGESSITIGISNQATGKNAVAIGNEAIASGIQSFSAGSATRAEGDDSYALGSESVARGQHAFAMGVLNNANGFASFALGAEATASGHYAVAMGSETVASGQNATALGYGTNASNFASMAIGNFNTIDPNPQPLNPDIDPDGYFDVTKRLFVIGNGTGVNDRSDAFMVLRNGKVGVNYPGFEGLSDKRDAKLQVWGNIAAKGLTMNIKTGNTFSTDIKEGDYTVILNGNITLPAPTLEGTNSNVGRMLYLCSDGQQRTIFGTIKDAGTAITSINVSNTAGSKCYTVQSDGTAWWIIGQR
ncbi:MAG: hypothetical protein Q4G27_05990 [Flavobacteriaceae bacterium]|nr:hypothetical protein [Flavobacteriaceae bacterium]